MYKETIHNLNDQAVEKYRFFNKAPFRYLLVSIIAGAYVGIGSIMLFAIGEPLYHTNSPFIDLLTGATFGVALALVIFAGSELFTGNNMVFTSSTLSKVTTWGQTFKLWGWCYLGNLIGSILLAILVFAAGVFKDIGAAHYMFSIAETKMNTPIHQLFFQGILCNWIVCLAIWVSLRVKEDIAKMFMIFVLILAFIAAGFEHSVANMSILGIALLHSSSEMFTLGGFFYNLIPVTLGNIIGGGVFVAGLYFAVSFNKGEIHQEKKKRLEG
ncbi:formate/nitrite transporter family protein [Alkalihalobacillus pseudalcaliphilus]|uniref:formate/nitrite transporter family protein n=1 Tax=Alkalihalobacillus pseudalcaliphilus TaxID=79884 RepID=UPI00064DC872|nr:formate/nitrite transporter family protein [Alkalihalobacillus pseudalcaliphilus]KMK75103.1 nitrite transporter NirC [Alkalihalobacillus pseudalcaliphilus]